ncbi:hypothetical protein GPECTOR_15g381 [Gonium pectorale]|uniref:NUA/TPR/MLP1-2-like domain-containing protein n=1 Tax=Gonium pectorale TaxID=33097 RepID=A0A150GLM7_GONPE|nr:hypothetical protein GPECTOR_15g381 [Gonium pectorale]|eukprot:KXZ50697.1 hypothetical protein GPECTOR_15g381 [Gonium pectorale]
MEANQMSYSLALQRYQQDEERWDSERKELHERVAKLEADLQQSSQAGEEMARISAELRAKQRAVEELQGALDAACEQRANSAQVLESLKAVLAARTEEVESLGRQKAELTELVRGLQASLSSSDSRMQTELLQTQYDQERKYWEAKLKLLEEDLETRNAALLEEKRRSATEHLALRQRVSELEYGMGLAEGGRTRLEAQLREMEGFLREARNGADPVTPAAGLGSGGGGGSTPGAELFAGRTVLEVWAMYQDMQDAWHRERGEVRRLNGFLESVAAELEAKAAFSERQEEEAAKLREAMDKAMATVSGLEDSNRELHGSLASAQASLQRRESEARAAEQTIRDLSQQVMSLVEEVQRLGGRPIQRTASAGGAGAGPSGGGGGALAALGDADSLLNSGDVISSRLVTFRSLEELVEQNRRLLALVRQLSSDSERSRAEVAEDVGRAFAAREAEYRWAQGGGEEG